MEDDTFILHASHQPITVYPDKLYKHFASTAECVTVSMAFHKDELHRLISALAQDPWCGPTALLVRKTFQPI